MSNDPTGNKQTYGPTPIGPFGAAAFGMRLGRLIDEQSINPQDDASGGGGGGSYFGGGGGMSTDALMSFVEDVQDNESGAENIAFTGAELKIGLRLENEIGQQQGLADQLAGASDVRFNAQGATYWTNENSVVNGETDIHSTKHFLTFDDNDQTDKYFKSGTLGTMPTQLIGTCGFASLAYARQEMSGGSIDYGDIAYWYVSNKYSEFKDRVGADITLLPRLIQAGIKPFSDLVALANNFFTTDRFSGFISSIDAGFPVVTFIATKGDDGGHGVLVVGYQPGSDILIYMDPEIGSSLSRQPASVFNTEYATPLTGVK